jgi:group I intron endonuclease
VRNIKFNVLEENKNKFGIYAIRNIINGQCYIGQTGENFKRRYLHHNWKLHNESHDNKYLQRAWNKYGDDNFEFIIIKVVDDPKLLDELEIKYISEYKDKLLSYNMLGGGGGRRGYAMSDKTKQLIGEKNRAHMTGRKLSEETKRKISEANKANIMKNINRSTTKLNDDIAREIKQMLVDGISTNKISKQLNVEYRHINNILSNNTWKHVHVDGWDEYRAARPKKKRKSPKEHKQIYDEYVTGKYTIQELGERYDLSSAMISKIINKYKEAI